MDPRIPQRRGQQKGDPPGNPCKWENILCDLGRKTNGVKEKIIEILSKIPWRKVMDWLFAPGEEEEAEGDE